MVSTHTKEKTEKHTHTPWGEASPAGGALSGHWAQPHLTDQQTVHRTTVHDLVRHRPANQRVHTESVASIEEVHKRLKCCFN